MDICGEFKAAPQHERFAVVLIDKYSKWPEVCLTGNISTNHIIDFLQLIWSRWGIPTDITTDNGVQFGTQFSNYLTKLGIQHKKSPLYSPSTNGNVERFNRTLKEGTAAHMSTGWNFRESVQDVLAAYRATKSQVTGKSPAELMFGREIRTPLSVIRPERKKKTDVEVRRRIIAKKEYSKNYTDKTRNAMESNIKVGDFIRICLPKSKVTQHTSKVT